MRKHHYFEFMDLKHYPNILREVMTDTLTNITMYVPIFDRIAPIILDVMDKTETNEILDLCSGAGGPWGRLFGLVRKERSDVKLTFTDLYPNPKCMDRFHSSYQNSMTYETEPINALNVPKNRRGVRTFFGSFHHMSPKNAVKVLEDAAKKKVGIVVAESYSHSPSYLWRTLILQILISPLYFLMLWVFMLKAMRGTTKEKIIKIIFTYLIPIVPLSMIFDTFISGVRVYMKEDLEEMVKQIHVKGYRWEPGNLPKQMGQSAISYIVGYPEKMVDEDSNEEEQEDTEMKDNSNVILKTEGISKEFGTYKALDNISIELERGKIYGLIGKNGAGKTTLMRILTGLSYPTKGDFQLFGKTKRVDVEHELRRVGSLIENPSLDPKMTANQNLMTYRLLKGDMKPSNGKSIKEENEELLSLVGLNHVGKKKVKNFSLGMRQRLGIAIALIGHPDLLILDEPVNGLDPVGVIELRALIKKLAKEFNITILVSSHNLPELHQVATNYLIIDNGCMIKELTLNQLNEECAREIYVDSVEVDTIRTILQEKKIACEKISNQCIHILDYNFSQESFQDLMEQKAPNVKYNYFMKGQSLEEYFVKLVEGKAND